MYKYPQQGISTSYGYGNNMNKVIFKLQTNRAIFFVNLTVKVYQNRISLEYRPYIGGGERRDTFSAMDVGYVYIKKSRTHALIGAKKVNSDQVLFEVKGLDINEAEDLKDALDEMMNYRFANY